MTNAGSSSLAIVIVNYNSAPEILACLRSLEQNFASNRCEIIVADNGSTDSSIALITAQYPHVRVLLLHENRGFAAACNAGMQAAVGTNILLLNPDTETDCAAVSALFGALQEHPQWGIVGARMVNGAGRPYRAARRLPTVRDLVFSATGLARLFPHSRYWNGYLYGERALESLDEVEQVEGSCLLISAAARQAVGDLDERFFIFFEEVDWCKRVREAGFEIHVVPSVEVKHHISTTMGRHYERTREYHAQSAMAYFRKHHGESGYRALRRAMRWALMLRAAMTGLPALLNIGNMRRRFSGTLRELATYRRGLSA